MRFEYRLGDGTRADYVLCDRHGRAMAVIEAKKAAINPAEAQARAYAAQLKVPYVFLTNGEEIRFWEWQTEAFPRLVKNFFAQDDLERRAATAQVRRDPLSVPIDRRIVERGYQTVCIDTLGALACPGWNRSDLGPLKACLPPPMPVGHRLGNH